MPRLPKEVAPILGLPEQILNFLIFCILTAATQDQAISPIDLLSGSLEIVFTPSQSDSEKSKSEYIILQYKTLQKLAIAYKIKYEEIVFPGLPDLTLYSGLNDESLKNISTC